MDSILGLVWHYVQNVNMILLSYLFHLLSYDHFSFFIFIFFVKRGHARGSIAFRAHFQRTDKQRCELVIEAFRRPTVHRDNITLRMFAFTRFQENTL